MQLPISLLKVAVHAESIIEQIHVNINVLLKNKSGHLVNLGSIHVCGVISVWHAHTIIMN